MREEAEMFHKAIDLKLLEGTALTVTFQDGTVKRYDMRALFAKYPQLQALKDRSRPGRAARRHDRAADQTACRRLSRADRRDTNAARWHSMACGRVRPAISKARSRDLSGGNHHSDLL